MEDRFETFTVLINRISRNIRKIKNQAMEEFDLKGPHISCLYYLYNTDGLVATELCERCEEDKATVSRALDYLEKNGYVICKSSSAKRYNAPFFLTEAGKHAGSKIAEKVSAVLSEMDKGLSDEDRGEFYRCLAIISDSFDVVLKKSEKKGKK